MGYYSQIQIGILFIAEILLLVYAKLKLFLIKKNLRIRRFLNL